ILLDKTTFYEAYRDGLPLLFIIHHIANTLVEAVHFNFSAVLKAIETVFLGFIDVLGQVNASLSFKPANLEKGANDKVSFFSSEPSSSVVSSDGEHVGNGFNDDSLLFSNCSLPT